MQIKMSDKVIVPTDVMARAVGEDLVILNLKSGTYFGLDPIGAKIWQLLVGQKTFQEVRDALLLEYEVSSEILERDILKLVTELCKQQLVEVAPG